MENPLEYLGQAWIMPARFSWDNYAPEPLGDYYAGPNHVLPTSGTARFFSPLSVVLGVDEEDRGICIIRRMRSLPGA